MKTCVLIPAYNEAKTIKELVLNASMQGLSVIVVNDGSKDSTSDIAKANGAMVVTHKQNQGKGASLIDGFAYAKDKGFDAVITMDGDGQHHSADIPYFIRLANFPKSGILIGNRIHKPNKMPFIRLLTNKFMSWLISGICKQHIPDSQCGFRLIKKDALAAVKLTTQRYETESELLIKAARSGIKIESVNIRTIYSKHKSRINPLLDTARFIKFIIKVTWSSKH